MGVFTLVSSITNVAVAVHYVSESGRESVRAATALPLLSMLPPPPTAFPVGQLAMSLTAALTPSLEPKAMPLPVNVVSVLDPVAPVALSLPVVPWPVAFGRQTPARRAARQLPVP